MGAASGEVALLVPAGNTRTLVRVPLGGGAPREVATNVLAAEWTRGGDFAVVREQGGRQRLEFPLGRVVYETSDDIAYVRASPSGRYLAFNENLRGFVWATVRVIAAAGPPVLTSTGWVDVRGLAWPSDERSVWLSATKREGAGVALWRVSLEGSERVAYRGADPLLVWDVGPDGRILASAGRYRYEMAGRAPGETTERDLTWLGRSFVSDVSANGEAALFEDGGFAKGQSYMFLRRTDASAPVLLAPGTPAGLSPDGRWALGFPRAEGDYQRRLIVVPAGAGQGHELPRGTIDRYLDAFWFPDGRKVLIVAHEKDRPLRLFEQGAEEGEPRPVTPEGVATSHPTLTPDGSAVLAAAFEAGSLFRLYPLGGGEGRSVLGSCS